MDICSGASVHSTIEFERKKKKNVFEIILCIFRKGCETRRIVYEADDVRNIFR